MNNFDVFWFALLGQQCWEWFRPFPRSFRPISNVAQQHATGCANGSNMLHPTMSGVAGQQCTGLIFAMFTSPIIHLVSLPKFCISIVLSFSFDDCITHEKLKTKVMQNSGGKQGVSWWICNLHISHNTAVQGEIEDTAYAKFGGKTRRIMGEVQMANMS